MINLERLIFGVNEFLTILCLKRRRQMQMEKSYYLNCNQNIILFASLSIRSNLIEKFDGGHREEMDKSHVLFSY